MDEANLFTEIEKRFTNKYTDIKRIATFGEDFNSKHYADLGFSYQEIF
jgi:hypothetical protein